MRRATWLMLPLAFGLLPCLASEQGSGSSIEQAIEEFKVQTGNLGLRGDSSRRSKRSSGGFSEFHGRLFWNIRNDAFDAVPHEVRQTGGEQSILRRNQYGFNLSGPVQIPKLFHGGRATFFSLSYEGVRETIGRSYVRSIPTMPERTGDFSQVVDKAGEILPIYDPAATRPNPDYDPARKVSTSNLQYLRDPFPGNRIPVDRLAPRAVNGAKHYPAPNVAIGPFFQNNYASYSPETNKADGMRGKVDHTAGEDHRLTASFAFSNGYSGPARYFPTIANPGRPNRDFRSRSISVGHTHTLSPTSVNNFRAAAWYSSSEDIAESEGGAGVFPAYRFSEYLGMGRSYPNSRSARAHWEIDDGISFRFGKHSVRMGAELAREQLTTFNPQYPSGRFDFTDGMTSLPGIVNTGHSFASYMLGLVQYAEGTVALGPSYFRMSSGGFSIRDEWELQRNLTLTTYVTISVFGARVEKYDRQSTVDLEAINPENGLPGALAFAGRDGRGRSFQPVHVRVDPYFALSWSPLADNKTVVRASYRWRHLGPRLDAGQWGTQGFVGRPTAITENAQLAPAITLRDGMPALPNPLPDLRPEGANDTEADLIDDSSRLPLYRYAHLSVERQLPGSMILTVGVMHTTGRNIYVDNDGANPNAISLDALTYRDLLNDEEFRKQLRPYPQYQRFNVDDFYPAGSYQRTEGYVRAEKRTSQGLSLRAAYEYAKQFDDYRSRGSGGLQDYINRANERALSYYADPHTISLTYMYELPFGPNKPLFTATDWRKFLVAGWAISGVTSYTSGDPLSLTAQFNNTGSLVDTLYVDAVPGVDPKVKNPGPELWFNPAAFVNPPNFAVGHVSRTHPVLRNPIRQNHDLSVTKRFSLASERAVEFIGTAFNFVNHANWNQPDMEIGSRESPNVNAGKIIGSDGGRVVQLGLRFTF